MGTSPNIASLLPLTLPSTRAATTRVPEQLEIGNITMAKGKVTWSRKGGKEKSAIDFIIMNEHMKSRMQEIIIDEEKEIDLQSDHNMIITKLKIKEQVNTRNIIQTNKKWKRKNVDWTKYKEEIGKARSITGRSKEEKNEQYI